MILNKWTRVAARCASLHSDVFRTQLLHTYTQTNTHLDTHTNPFNVWLSPCRRYCSYTCLQITSIQQKALFQQLFTSTITTIDSKNSSIKQVPLYYPVTDEIKLLFLCFFFGFFSCISYSLLSQF